jgi:uncharacterized membrane protein YccC
MARIERALTHVRQAAEIAPARPAYAAGVRAAVTTVAPLALDAVLQLGAGTWMSLAGFNAALSDRGGAYGTRVRVIAVLTAASAVVAALGALAGAHLAVAVPLAFAVAFAASLSRAWSGPGAPLLGVPVLNTFVISLAFPATGPAEALARAGWVVAGGAWATLMAVFLWPIWPYRPLRRAVAACWRALAAYAGEVAVRASGDAPPMEWQARPRVAEVRAALEAARAALAATRRGRPGESGPGERLLVLREVADQLLGQLVALADVAESIPPAGRDPAADAALAEPVRAAAGAFRALAEAIERETPSPPVAASWSGGALREAAGARTVTGEVGEARTQYLHAAAVLDRLAQYTALGAANAAALHHGGPAPGVEGIGETDDEPAPPLRMRIRDSVAEDSVVRRYALRVALVTAAAVGVGAALGLPRGYWITVTAIIILQPYTGATTQRALQRIAGTVLGGVLTAALGAAFHDHPAAIPVLAFVFCGICVALLPLNYAVFSVFLTPTFVLLAEAGAGDWHLAGLRVVNTLVGGALALLGARLLWPAPEWRRLPAHAAAALRANRGHLRAALELIGDRGPEAGRELRAARRGVGLALMDAEESFQRLIGEHRGGAEALEPMMTLLTFSRRLGASTGALALARHEAQPSAGALEPFARAAAALLDDVAGAVEEGRPPAPPPPLLVEDTHDAPLPPLLRARVDRIARQLKTLHDAAARMPATEEAPRRARLAG